MIRTAVASIISGEGEVTSEEEFKFYTVENLINRINSFLDKDDLIGRVDVEIQNPQIFRDKELSVLQDALILF